MRAWKMNGTGNAFLLLDQRAVATPREPDENMVRSWAQQHGFDQLIWLGPDPDSDARLRFWNRDGGEVGACGNGTRAAGWHVMQSDQSQSASLHADGGRLLTREAGPMNITVDMGEPRLDWSAIPLAKAMDTQNLDFSAEHQGYRVCDPGAVNMGNPHVVFFIDDMDTLPIEGLGALIETHPLFPERVNVGFAHIRSPGEMRLRVFERGTGVTLACGTGACAALVAAHRRGLTGRTVRIEADGGWLSVDWNVTSNHIHLTGEVEREESVELNWET